MADTQQTLDALKNTVLPLIVPLTDIAPGQEGYIEVKRDEARAQRDADWQRVRSLVIVLQVLADPKSYGTEGVPVKITNIAAAFLREIGVQP